MLALGFSNVNYVLLALGYSNVNYVLLALGYSNVNYVLLALGYSNVNYVLLALGYNRLISASFPVSVKLSQDDVQTDLSRPPSSSCSGHTHVLQPHASSVCVCVAGN